jgi:hypothetical protein
MFLGIVELIVNKGTGQLTRNSVKRENSSFPRKKIVRTVKGLE